MIGATVAVVAPVAQLAWRVATFTPPQRVTIDPLTARTTPPGNAKPQDLRALASQGPGELAGAALGGEAWAGEPAGMRPLPERATRILGLRRSLGGQVEELVQWEARASPETVRAHYEAEAARAGFRPVTAARLGGAGSKEARAGVSWSRAFARAGPSPAGGTQTLVLRIGPPQAGDGESGEALRVTLWLRYATDGTPGPATDGPARERDRR
jgi:hypothetical protein